MIFPNVDFGIVKTPDLKIIWWIVLLGVLMIIANIPLLKGANNLDSSDIMLFKESKELHEKFEEIINSAQKEIIFWGGNFYYSVNENRSMILEKLRKGITIKYLIFNPESPFCNYVSRDFNEIENTFYDQSITTIKNLKGIKAEWDILKLTSKKGGGLEIRLFNNIPRLRIYMIDTQSENSYSYIVHFLYKIDSSKVPVYKIRNNYKGIVENYLESFNNLWESADTITLEEYLKMTSLDVFKEDKLSHKV